MKVVLLVLGLFLVATAWAAEDEAEQVQDAALANEDDEEVMDKRSEDDDEPLDDEEEELDERSEDDEDEPLEEQEQKRQARWTIRCRRCRRRHSWRWCRWHHRC